MNVYLIEFDHENNVVEAPNYAKAVALWRAFMQTQDADWDVEPEQVVRIVETPVIRGEVPHGMLAALKEAYDELSLPDRTHSYVAGIHNSVCKACDQRKRIADLIREMGGLL